MKKILIIVSVVLLIITGVLLGFFINDQKSGIKINFYSSFDGIVETINIEKGESIKNIKELKKDGYIFEGWFLDDNCEQKVDENTIFYNTVTLKAGWIKIVNIEDINKLDKKFKNIKIQSSSVINRDQINKLLSFGFNKIDFSDCIFSENKITSEDTKNLNINKLILPNSLIEISDNTFKNKNIEEIIMNNNLKTIGNYSFYGTKIKNIEIPDSVEFIGNYSFAYTIFENFYISKNCNFLGKCFLIENNNIKNISISNENLNYSIENNILYNKIKTEIIYVNPNIKEFIYKETVEKINEYAFYNCKNLNEINLLLNTNERKEYIIEDYAFANCENLKSFKTAHSVKLNIGDYVFSNCKNLETVLFESGLERLGNYCFNNCLNLKNLSFNLTTAPGVSNLTTIGDGLFNNCISIKQIILPSDILNYGSYLFNNCISLNNIDIRFYCNNLNDYTFNNCKNLETLKINGNIVSVGNYTFYNCEKYNFNNLNFNNTQTFGIGCFKNCKVLENININNCKEISEEMFSGCENLKSIKINAPVKKNAFYNCKNLNEININEKCISIDEDAFYNYINLSTINVNNNDYFKVEENVLYTNGFKKILLYAPTKFNTEFNIKKEVEDISKNAFIYAEKIVRFTKDLDNSIFEIKNDAIYKNEELIIFPISSTLEVFNISNGSIKTNSFYNNKNIKTLVINNGVNVEFSALSNMKTLQSLTILEFNDYNKYIGYIFGANNYYENNLCVPATLTYIKIGGITNISSGMFYGLENIENIETDENSRIIEEKAFANCKNLKSININGNIEEINSNIISGSNKLKTIKLGYYNNIKLSSYAFSGYNNSITLYIHYSRKITDEERKNYKEIFHKINITRNWLFVFN